MENMNEILIFSLPKNVGDLMLLFDVYSLL